MNLRSVLPVALLASLSVPLLAQEAATTEEEINFTLPTDEWYVPKSTLSFGVRMLSKGAKVTFGGLGNVALIAPEGALADGARIYTTGQIYPDAVRQGIEPITTGNLPEPDATVGHYVDYTVDQGDYYQVRRRTREADTDGAPAGYKDEAVGLGLKYVAGRSREWQAGSVDQIDGSRVRMSNYWSTTQGASIEEEEGFNPGLEVALARTLGTFGRKFEWGLTAGVALNTLNAKAGGTVQATLMRRSDFYEIFGPLPAGVAGGPTFGHYPANPDPQNNNQELTAPISTTPDEIGTPVVVGNVDVRGNWQIKGAYFMVRVGPSVRAQVASRFGVSASAGVAGAYAGARYSVIEQINVPELTEPVIDERWDADSKILAGFYADVNVDWAATERTGLFAGVSMQQFGGYEMSVGGRMAKIDLGNAVGLRGGINVKF